MSCTDKREKEQWSRPRGWRAGDHTSWKAQSNPDLSLVSSGIISVFFWFKIVPYGWQILWSSLWWEAPVGYLWLGDGAETVVSHQYAARNVSQAPCGYVVPIPRITFHHYFKILYCASQFYSPFKICSSPCSPNQALSVYANQKKSVFHAFL